MAVFNQAEHPGNLDEAAAALEAVRAFIADRQSFVGIVKHCAGAHKLGADFTKSAIDLFDMTARDHRGRLMNRLRVAVAVILPPDMVQGGKPSGVGIMAESADMRGKLGLLETRPAGSASPEYDDPESGQYIGLSTSPDMVQGGKYSGVGSATREANGAGFISIQSRRDGFWLCSPTGDVELSAWLKTYEADRWPELRALQRRFESGGWTGGAAR